MFRPRTQAKFLCVSLIYFIFLCAYDYAWSKGWNENIICPDYKIKILYWQALRINIKPKGCKNLIVIGFPVKVRWFRKCEIKL